MNENTIRACFAKNWIFRLYLQNKVPFWLINVTLPVLVWLVGAIIAVFLGVFLVYIQNPLAYIWPGGIGVALLGFRWIVINLPKALETLYPAIEVTTPEFLSIIEKWANRTANQHWLIIIGGMPILILNFLELLNFWRNPNLIWFGSPWVQSNRSMFFALYWGFSDILIASFTLGSGIVIIIGSALLTYELLNIPLKIDYYRRLEVISRVSIGISFWTSLAVTGALAFSIYSQPSNAQSFFLTSLMVSLIISTVLFLAFFTPILMAQQAIKQAKIRQISAYENTLYDLSQKINSLMRDIITMKREESVNYREELTNFIRIHNDINQHINSIEKIPAWPVSFTKILQLLSTSILLPLLTTVLGVVSNLLLSSLNIL